MIDRGRDASRNWTGQWLFGRDGPAHVVGHRRVAWALDGIGLIGEPTPLSRDSWWRSGAGFEDSASSSAGSSTPLQYPALVRASALEARVYYDHRRASPLFPVLWWVVRSVAP